MFITVARLFEVVPEELKKIKRLKIHGQMLMQLLVRCFIITDLKEFSYYTVMFAVSRSIGFNSSSSYKQGNDESDNSSEISYNRIYKRTGRVKQHYTENYSLNLSFIFT